MHWLPPQNAAQHPHWHHPSAIATGQALTVTWPDQLDA